MTPTDCRSTDISRDLSMNRSGRTRSILPLAVGTLLTVAALSSCGLENPLEPDPIAIRILAIEYDTVPTGLSDEQAMNDMRTSSNFFAVTHEFWFYTTDSAIGRLANRVIVTPASGSNNGSTQLFGGQNFSLHPAESGVPSSMSISAPGVNGAGQTGTFGTFEILFNGTEVVAGSGTDGAEMEFVLESFDSETTEATGRFMFIAHNLTNPADTVRWGVKGVFTLRAD